MEHAHRVYDGDFASAGEAVRSEKLPVSRQLLDYYVNKLREEGGRVSQRAKAQGEIVEARADAMAAVAAEDSSGALVPGMGEGAGLDETLALEDQVQDASQVKVKVIERTLYTVREEGTGQPLLGTKQLQVVADDARKMERQHLTHQFDIERDTCARDRAVLERMLHVLTQKTTELTGKAKSLSEENKKLAPLKRRVKAAEKKLKGQKLLSDKWKEEKAARVALEKKNEELKAAAIKEREKEEKAAKKTANEAKEAFDRENRLKKQAQEQVRALKAANSGLAFANTAGLTPNGDDGMIQCQRLEIARLRQCAESRKVSGSVRSAAKSQPKHGTA